MELADMQDLGAVTLGKVFPVPHLLANGKYRFACSYKCGLSVTLHLGQPPRVRIRGTKEYAGVVELADSTDLGAVTSGKVFLLPLSLRAGAHTGVAIRSLQ